MEISEQELKEKHRYIYDKYFNTHKIEKVMGLEIDLKSLKDDESVIYGDGETFYFKLTKNTIKRRGEEEMMNSFWKPTMKLRFITKKHVPMEILQQKWVDVKGKTEWRDVPTVNK